MTTHGDGIWEQVSLGAERALRRRASDGATFLFGQGPAGRDQEPEGRIFDLGLALGQAAKRLCRCRQVHGIEVHVVKDPGDEGSIPACDGLLTTAPGIALLVQTADCVPILVAGRRLVAAVHAGWRGAAGGIVHSLLDRCRQADHEEPGGLRVFLGPAICGDHYPVGPEVIAALATQGVDPSRWRCRDHVDLRAFLAAQLRSLGVDHVRAVGPCTACDPALASYRRDGQDAGRQLSVVYRSRP